MSAAAAAFTSQDRSDLREMYRIYDFSKVDKVADIIAEAEKAGQSPSALFDDLYKLFDVQKMPKRNEVADRLRQAVAEASDADVESAIRQAEMKGFTESDAARSLERLYSVQHANNRVLPALRNTPGSPRRNSLNEQQSELLRASSSLRHVAVNETSMTSSSGLAGCGADVSRASMEAPGALPRTMSRLSATLTRENLDEIMAEEVREWVAKMVGDMYNSEVLSMPNFIDALRSGVVLHVLLQKMEDPPVADDALKLPKRTTGFFIRDNVATFLKAAKKRYSLVDAQLFTDSDLVDGKSDRQVVTCLMAMARIAFAEGSIKLAPSIIMFEHDIEQQQRRLSRIDLDRIVQEAEDDEAIPSPIARAAPQQPVAPAPSHSAPVSGATSPAASSQNTSHKSAPATMDGELVTSDGECAAAGLVAADEPVPSSGPESVHAEEGSQAETEAAPQEDAAPATPPPSRPASTLPPPANERTLSPSMIAPDEGKDGEEMIASAPTTVEEAPLSRKASEPPLSRKASEPPQDADNNAAAGKEAAKADKPKVPTTPSTPPAGGGPRPGSSDSGRVFYLRDGMLRPVKPTPEEEKAYERHRRAPAPRVVWKRPSVSLESTKPPRYHSRHWDGIDVALGRHVNQHYEKYEKSPWRFRMVASTSGEYVLYNRANAHKRLVYLRIIQAQLFLRNVGKNQPWMGIDDALAALERPTA